MKENILKAYYNTIINESYEGAIKIAASQGIPEEIVKELAEIDPTKNKKYLEWMVRVFKVIPEIDKYTVIKDFDKYPIPNKDITSYKNIEQVYDAVRDYQGNKVETKIEKLNVDPKDIWYKNNKCIILKPSNKENSCKYGSGTTWCTAATSSNNYFNSYYKDRGVNLYYIIPNINLDSIGSNLSKVAIATHTNGDIEIFNAIDKKIDSQILIKIIKALEIDPRQFSRK